MGGGADRLGSVGEGRKMTRTLRAEGPAPTLQRPFAGREWARNRQEEASPGQKERSPAQTTGNGSQGPMASQRAQGGRVTLCGQKVTAGWTGPGQGGKGPRKEGDPGQRDMDVGNRGGPGQGTRGHRPRAGRGSWTRSADLERTWIPNPKEPCAGRSMRVWSRSALKDQEGKCRSGLGDDCGLAPWESPAFPSIHSHPH